MLASLVLAILAPLAVSAAAVPTPIAAAAAAGPTQSGVPAPGPTQPGVTKVCERWDLVKAGDSCASFVKKYPGVTTADLIKWNPAIGKDCTNMWANFYICTDDPTGRPPHTFPGIAKDCERWNEPSDALTCDWWVDRFKITVDKFYQWNPSIGPKCENLVRGHYYCTLTKREVDGWTTKQPTATKTVPRSPANAPNPTPSPVQAGITKKCKTFHKVVKGDTCWSLTKGDKKKIADLQRMNPAIKKDCSGLWANYYICVAEK